MNKEIWKDISGYEGLYQVSNLGRVKSLENRSNHKKEKILASHIRNQYYGVTLYKDSHYKNYTIHRLVAEAFIPNPDNLPEVNHKDENKLNNYVDNLEWCNKKYNINYGHGAVNRQIQNRERGLSMGKKVLCVETGVIYSSIIEAYRQTGIGQKEIINVCKGKPHYKTAGGYHWKYVDEEV